MANGIGAIPAYRANIVCDGQSMFRYPHESGTVSGGITPATALRHLLPNVCVQNAAVTGSSITVLSNDASSRVDGKLVSGLLNIWVFAGGQTDMAEGDTGQQIYDQLVTYRNARISAGFTYAVACTMSPSPNWVVAGWEDERTDFNAALLADASNAFDDVVNWHSTGNLATVPGVAYVDTTHFNSLGAYEAAGYLNTSLEALIP